MEKGADLLEEYSQRIAEVVQNNHYDYLQYAIAAAAFNEDAASPPCSWLRILMSAMAIVIIKTNYP